MQGDGCIFQRGKVWWVQYCQNGRIIRKSAHTTVKEEAKNRLKLLVKKCRTDENFFDSLLPGRATISELVADLFSFYKTVKQKQQFALESQRRWDKHLKAAFGEMQADHLKETDILAYRVTRQEQGASPATANRELQVIKAALTYGANQTPPRVLRVPKFEWAPEDNARQVFVNKDDENKLKEAAAKRSLACRVWVEMAFTYGWRLGELMRIRPSNISLVDGTIRLDRTKNSDPRSVPITEGLRPLLSALLINRGSERLFPFHPAREWPTLCKLAELPHGKKGGLTFHDIRRSSARNKRAAGVDASVIMQIQGWRSASVFRRYAIVSSGDMMAAFEKEKAASDTALCTAEA
jgi:integrase